MVIAYQKYPQKELVANVLCCDDFVPQSSPLIGTKDHSSKIKEIKRSTTWIKGDQKIKDQVVSRINGSKFIRDQRSTRSKIMKINWRSSSFRSEIKSSKFNFSQIRSLIWSQFAENRACLQTRTCKKLNFEIHDVQSTEINAKI